MRAIAALSVVLFHLSFFNAWARPDHFTAPYVSRAEVGVTIFFLISGFLLYRPFALARRADASSPSLAGYAWRRVLRILPAYWVALTVIGLALAADELFDSSLPVYYGLLQIYSDEYALGFQGFGQAWSIAVEISFYVMLPLFAMVMRAVPARSERSWFATELAGLGCLFVVGVGYKLLVLGPDVLGTAVLRAGSSELMLLPNFLDQFAIGMALGVIALRYERRPRLPAALRAVERRPGVCWLVAAVAFWAVSTQIGLRGGFESPTETQVLARHALFTLVAAALLLPAVFGSPERGLLRRLLGTRTLQWLGLISYGIFLWHLGWLFQLDAWGFDPAGGNFVVRDLAWPLVAVGGAIGLGALSWYLVERPALSFKGLFPRSTPPPTQEAAAEVNAPARRVS